MRVQCSRHCIPGTRPERQLRDGSEEVMQTQQKVLDGLCEYILDWGGEHGGTGSPLSVLVRLVLLTTLRKAVLRCFLNGHVDRGPCEQQIRIPLREEHI